MAYHLFYVINFKFILKILRHNNDMLNGMQEKSQSKVQRFRGSGFRGSGFLEFGIRNAECGKSKTKPATRNSIRETHSLDREPCDSLFLPQTSDLKPNASDFYPMP
jgi:hypothetical protein